MLKAKHKAILKKKPIKLHFFIKNAKQKDFELVRIEKNVLIVKLKQASYPTIFSFFVSR